MQTNTNLPYEQMIALLAELFADHYARYGAKIVQFPLTIRPLCSKRDMSSSKEQMLRILLSSTSNGLTSAGFDKEQAI
ncbi:MULTISPECIES: hypothetical protein [unclassified Paenibacillus]|uniref:hypothetical protein n=1 Tax=unclassified Paenibacillus TaxID=185978 RepID=UPI002476F119|nr:MULTISPECIES: hypothetical protein [unclassified Paenibacillus]MDH6429056.1 hypothetical protein [Paenibacillus sp. PastH-4]MDH6445261.1 hypothetical protein [Paenibacillus sp. PastF-4]MDH6529151.1 hypothetical protein [Paenibacillus sp. PastH-3]